MSEHHEIVKQANPDLLALAIEIADESALITIESQCPCDDWSKADDLRWWMTDLPNAIAAGHVKRAVEYLNMRGVLERHPEHAAWVRWPA